MKRIIISALVLALAISAKAGWDHLPTSGNVIDRRGESVPIQAKATLFDPALWGKNRPFQTTPRKPEMPFVPLHIPGMGLAY